MAVRAESGTGEHDGDGARNGAATTSFGGSLDAMLGPGPVFRSRMRGYDPMEVDTYVSWAESELRSVRRQVDDLLARYGACSAELEISRRLLAEAPRGRVVFPVSDRVEEMLQLAADEAAAITEEGAREAERLLAEARSEADARLRRAHEVKEVAVRAADELRDQARKDRAEAAQERERLVAEAAAERRRLDDEAAQRREQAQQAAEARLAEIEAQVVELERRRDQARESLRGLSSRIGEALHAVAAIVPDAMVGADVAVEGAVARESSVEMTGNVAIEGREYDPAHVGPGTAGTPAGPRSSRSESLR
jgi:cell division septum initiation protein DivIVA